MKPGSTYYAGGARVVIDGIPIRLARKPSTANLADMRLQAKFGYWMAPGYYSPKERAEIRVNKANRANRAFGRYGNALGITEKESRALVEKHWRHILANPLVDLSLEYDL